MSASEPVELLMAVHFDPPKGAAVLVSETGDARKAVWLPRRLISSYHLTGRSTRGTDRSGRPITLPTAHLTIPEWLAKREELI